MYASPDQLTRAQNLSELQPPTEELKDKFQHRKRLFNYCIFQKSSSRFLEQLADFLGDQHSELYEIFTANLDDIVAFAATLDHDENFDLVVKLANLFNKEHVREFIVLLDASDTIYEEYPFLDYSKAENKVLMQLDYPNEIIRKKLYLGDANQAKNLNLLRSIRVTHIFNVAKEVPLYHEGKFVYFKLALVDIDEQQIRDYVEVAFKFMEEALANGVLLVHCAQGRSRSACMVVMYLMRKYSLPFDAANDLVHSKREKVCINDGFCE